MFEYNTEELEHAYQLIYKDVKKEGVPQKKNCVFFVGGQPGAGKTNFHSQDNILDQYISIDGDRYRKYHPHYSEICHTNLKDMATITQDFVNYCVERLIRDLSDESYNLIIEGTLRESSVTINTCNYLKNKGYTTYLYVIATPAITSWESCLNRAKLLSELGEIPRMVPFDKYDYIVNQISDNLEKIEKQNCFDYIKVIDRNNKILYPNCDKLTASQVLSGILDLDFWNKKYNNVMQDPQVKNQSGLIRKRKGR